MDTKESKFRKDFYIEHPDITSMTEDEVFYLLQYKNDFFP